MYKPRILPFQLLKHPIHYHYLISLLINCFLKLTLSLKLYSGKLFPNPVDDGQQELGNPKEAIERIKYLLKSKGMPSDGMNAIHSMINSSLHSHGKRQQGW